MEPGINFCANASKIGEVTIHSPDLPNPLTGFVYLAAQESNPFGSLLALYLVAEDPVSGVLVKLAGEVQLCKGAGEVIAGHTCEALGQIVSTFANNPQLPFEDAELHFFGGERAPLATPPAAAPTPRTRRSRRGRATNRARRSTFDITSGPKTLSEPGGSPCPGASLPFSPSLTGGATERQRGRVLAVHADDDPPEDGEQNLQSVEAHLPPGLSGILSNIELCPEPQANLGECGPNSLIGETTVSVGVGGDPYTVSGGKFYLTGPYNGSGGCTVGRIRVRAVRDDVRGSGEGRPVRLRENASQPSRVRLRARPGQDRSQPDNGRGHDHIGPAGYPGCDPDEHRRDPP